MNSKANSMLLSKIADEEQFQQWRNLSTENLIIWIVGKSLEKKMKLSIEENTIESWVINSEKHSLRRFTCLQKIRPVG